MFNYNKRPKYRILTPVTKQEDAILENPVFKYPEDIPSDGAQENGPKVNYLRKPASKKGVLSFILSLMALLLFFAVLYFVIGSKGNPAENVSAMAGSSLVLSFFAVLYGLLSFSEKDSAHLFSWLGFSIGGVELIIWIMTIIAGSGT